MRIQPAKRAAERAGLELYYDRQWCSWGLIDPAMRVESLWLSPGQLASLNADAFAEHYVAVMQERIKEAAQ